MRMVTKMSFLMGIDLGTSSAKTIITDLFGNVVGSGQEDYSVLSPKVGYAEQDVECLWEATARTIKQALSNSSVKPSDIRSIGLSGQMHGLVLLNKQLKPIRPAIIWADQRSKQQIESTYNIIGINELREKTLNSLSTGFYICSLMWIRDNEPHNYDSIYKAVLPKDYIRFRLCGELATDVTDGSSTLAFDTAQRCWAFDIIEKIGVNTSIFPKHGEAYQIAGELSQECAEKTGLCSKTPVVYGGGDALMHSVGSGTIKPGIVSANIGTAGQISTAVNAPLYDSQFRTNTFCHAKNDMWIILGGHLNGGIALKWLKENYFPHLSFEDFNRLAEEIPAGSEGEMFLPYLSGERTPYQDPFAKGILFGMTLRHNYKHMIRAVMEGVILSLKLSLEIFEELNIPVEKMVASGGGAKSATWLQMQADIFNTEIHTVLGKEEACTGAAIVAGVGVGLYNSIEEGCSAAVKYSPKITVPNQENYGVYKEVFEKYKLLYSNNKSLFQAF
jgi:xylulokinase